MLAMAAIVACDKDDAPKDDPMAERTVLIYMAAQNNLTNWSGRGYRFAETDLKEIQQGIKNIGNNNLVVYVDKAKDPVASKDDHLPYLLRYRNGERQDSIPLYALLNIPEDSTALPCNPAVFEDIVKTAFKKFPAKDYGLVLWGHASGWLISSDTIVSNTNQRRAYGGTNQNESNNGSGDLWMNIPTLAKALKAVPKMRFIFADCCNMMCAEVAYELKDVCDYFIGSAAEIPGNGAPYDQVVPAMMEKETFYQSICDKYAAKYNDCIPLAVVKSSEMAQLADATMKVLQATKAADNLAQYPNLRNIIYYLDKNLYDINHFIKTYATESEYNSWKQALDKAIIYKKFAKYWTTMSHVNFLDFDMNEENFSGMSMFVPQWGLQNTDNKNIKLFGWYYAAGYDTIEW
jgi:hypothetical protein